MKRTVKTAPLLGPAARTAAARLRRLRFARSLAHWEARYAGGGASGDGPCGRLAAFKAEVVNGVGARHAVRLVIERGCGDEVCSQPRSRG